MLAIIQARLSSKRLKNKVMHIVNKKPLIWYVYRSVKKSKLIKKVVVATSNEKSDNRLANYLKNNKINHFRGDLNNVAKRLFIAAKNYNAKNFLRISADSPLIDSKIIDRGIRVFKKHKNYDIITNVFPRTFPSGQSIEIIKTNILKKILKLKLKKKYFEHVTLYFYLKKNEFKIKNFCTKKKFKKKKYSIDTKKDLLVLQNLIKKNFK